MTVLSILQTAESCVAPSELRAQSGLSHEDLYAELVRLDALGLARGIPRCFRRPGQMPEAGWISIEPEKRDA